MCLQQSITNLKRPEAGTEESSIPQHCQCILLCSGPRVKSPQVPQQPLLPDCVQLAAHLCSSHVLGLTSPWLSASKLHPVLFSIYNTSHLCRLSPLRFLTTSRLPWNNVPALLLILLCLIMSHTLVQRSFSWTASTFFSQWCVCLVFAWLDNDSWWNTGCRYIQEEWGGAWENLW